MAEEESLLTTLCAICHLQPPKYRCPRCSTRTCSLPCTKRHKVWSQCSGVRDPGAYVRRSELATESAFDRDFNFITGIERRIERAGRDAEDRGVDTDIAKKGFRDPGSVGLDDKEISAQEGDGRGKRKRGALSGSGPERGLPKGELGFLRRAQELGVKVIKAPKGMSREKANASRWFPKSKTLQWTVEFVTEDNNVPKRVIVPETSTIAEAYDRAFPLASEEKQASNDAQNQDSTSRTHETENTLSVAPEPTLSDTVPGSEPSASSTTTTTQPTTTAPEQDITPNPDPAAANTITSHRQMHFYIHRPRTATKQPVLSPLAPSSTLQSSLTGRVVLEFPTIYALQSSLTGKQLGSGAAEIEGKSSSASEPKYILESEYLRTHQGMDTAGSAGANEDGLEDQEADNAPAFGEVDIPDVDAGKMMEVLEKDLMG